jgi:hypothetical protein
MLFKTMVRRAFKCEQYTCQLVVYKVVAARLAFLWDI